MKVLKTPTVIGSTILGLVAAIALPLTAQTQGGSFTGTIESVWEDGFRLKSSDRTLTVDSWDLCGDNTTRYLSVGERITVTGEFEQGEFDAFTIAKSDGISVCPVSRKESFDD